MSSAKLAVREMKLQEAFAPTLTDGSFSESQAQSGKPTGLLRRLEFILLLLLLLLNNDRPFASISVCCGCCCCCYAMMCLALSGDFEPLPPSQRTVN